MNLYPATKPIPYDPAPLPAAVHDAINRQLRRRNARDAMQAEAAEIGQWCREQGPRMNQHGLYAPESAR